MVENGEESGRDELIFFDTFSHELNEKLNLDLVQFPNPVYISEIRIVPLGARVQADFPGGGNRLGATNPSQFDIEFFVNDLSVNVASTFEPLGKFSYNQNECINLECRNGDARRIPTDGLVLKGYYTTITLAVYGNIITIGNMQKIPSNNSVEESAAPQISSNDDANESDHNGEIYHHRNDFQDQNSSCDPTVSSTIADDMKFDERQNNSPVNVYSRSPSKEQESNNHKNKREWSNSDSPEESYQQQRNKRAKVYRNRSPPLQSPRISRPDSGDEIKKKSHHHHHHHHHHSENDFIDQSMHGDLSTTYCPSSPSLINNNTPIESPTEIMEDELEPILSDDDIIDDVNGIEELSDEMFAEEFSIKIFNPFNDNLRKVDSKTIDVNKMEKVREQLMKLSEEIDKSIEQDTSIVNENWPTLCEQLIHCLHTANENASAMENLIHKIDVQVKLTILSCIKNGLNYSLSTKYHQAGCNVRHLKAGIRLVECFSNNGNFLEWIIESQQFDLYQNLFDLFPRQLIPMPVKLLIARVVYKLIDSYVGFQQFTHFSGYAKLISLLSSVIDIRLLYTLKSIMKKVHVYETLEQIRITSVDFYRKSKSNVESDYDQILELEHLFLSLTEAHQKDVLQSRKFVPIVSQFEIVSKNKTPDFVPYYKIHNFMEVLVLLLNVKHMISSRLLLLVFDYLKLMLNNGKEFNYLSSNIEMLNDLSKILLESQITSLDTSKIDSGNDEMMKNYNIDLGLEISYKAETKYLMNSISTLTDEIEIAEHLNLLYYLCVGPGKRHVLNYIAMDDHLYVFLNLIDNEKKLYMAQGGSPGLKHKSPTLSYSVDIIDFVVRNVENLDYLKKFENILLNLVKHHDSFEPSVAAVFQELAVFLKPLEFGKLFDFDDVSLLIDNIKRSMEFLTNFPGDLIMTLRILRHLILNEVFLDYRELKSDYYAMLLYHADGVPTLLSVLEKITTHFDQPMIHSYLFGANQGVSMMKIVHPTVQVLRKIFVKVIESRNINFKDTTAIETLLKTFTLMSSIHSRCSIQKEAKEVQKEIIRILLMYTQSLTPDGMNTINIHKSLWTQMIGEVIKYTLNGPYRFISGLTVLSELLPLPLPIPVQGNSLNKLEIQRLITERQLWSAHLHPQSQLLMEMIQTFCISSSTDLITLLYRVCVQLSDLAPNMTLNVTRSITEMILTEASDKNNEGSSLLSRLLRFLALLVRHPCVKVSVLSILSGKFAEVLSQLLRIINDSNTDHVLSQFYVFVLLQNLFDCEISLLYNTDHSPELILASGLPFKELIAQFAEDVVDNFIKTSAENLHFASIRTMILLTEHDVTMKILKGILLSKDEKIAAFVERFNAIGEKCKNDRKHTQIIPDIMEFLRSLLIIETSEISVVPPRTITLSVDELSNLLKWNSEEYRNGNKIHFLEVFSALVNEPKIDENEDEIETGDGVVGINLKSDLDLLMEKLKSSTNGHQENVASSVDDISLPQAEGIVTQFSSRLTFYVTENLEEITADYWMLSTCAEDEDIQMNDQERYDLDELLRECLPDVNVISDCKRLLALSSSPQSNRDKTQTGLCFRTRRVEVSEAPQGRPEKKIFGKFPARGRGFSRVAIRGDIFRSRPPNTSRPPSLHVDDFVAMESGGQSTYSKIVSTPRGRGRGSSFLRGRVASSFSTNPRGHSTYPRSFRDSSHFRGRPIRSRGRGYPR